MPSRLCIHCKEYLHESCFQHIGRGCESKFYKQHGFLTFFAESSPDNKIKLQLSKIGRIVHIKDFAHAARLWLKEIQTEISACIVTFQEVKKKIGHVGGQEDDLYLLKERGHTLCEEEIDSILKFAKKTKITIKTLLDETTSDAEAAEAVQRTEEDCSACFRYRQKCAGYMLFVGAKTISTESQRSNIQQSNVCVLREISAKCTCIMISSHYSKPLTKSSEVTLDINIQSSYLLSCIFFGREEKNQRNNIKTATRHNNSVHFIVYCLNPNKFLDKYESTNHGMFIADFGSYISIVEVENGYIHEPSSNCERVYTNGKEIQLQSTRKLIQIIGLQNLVGLPTKYQLQGNSLNTQFRHINYANTKLPFVMQFTGNTGCGAGLQSIFLYYESSKDAYGHHDHSCVLGLSISATLAKFNKHINPHTIKLWTKPRPRTLGYTVIKDKKNAFTFVKDEDVLSNNFLMYYRSISTLVDGHDQSLLITERDFTKLQEHKPIPITFFHTSLLCHLESGLYFAKHNDMGDLTVGDITFDCQEIKPNMLHTVRQADTVVPVGKLKPFTMVERTNKDIIVVCAVEDDNSKFVVIQVGKNKSEAIEIINVDYSLSELRVYLTSETEGKDEALDQESLDLSALDTKPKHTDPSCKNDDAVHDQGLAVRDSNADTSTTSITEVDRDTNEKDKDAKDKRKDTKDKITKLDQSKIQSIAESTLVDLEMDNEGNIMLVLETNDGRSYCALTKYLLPCRQDGLLTAIYEGIYQMGLVCVTRRRIFPKFEKLLLRWRFS